MMLFIHFFKVKSWSNAQSMLIPIVNLNITNIQGERMFIMSLKIVISILKKEIYVSNTLLIILP